VADGGGGGVGGLAGSVAGPLQEPPVSADFSRHEALPGAIFAVSHLHGEIVHKQKVTGMCEQCDHVAVTSVGKLSNSKK
jgi:hypothetical protein